MSDSFAIDNEKPGEQQPIDYAASSAQARVGAIGTTFEPLTAEELMGGREPVSIKAVGAAATALAGDTDPQAPPMELASAAGETVAADEVVAQPAAGAPPVGTGAVALAAEPASLAQSEPVESRSEGMGCLRDALLVGLGSLLGAILALGFLFYVNGTIDFGQHERVKLLDSSIDTLQRQNDDLQSQLQQQVAGLDEVKANAAADAQRIAALKAQTDGAETAAQTAAQELDKRLAQTEAKTAAQGVAINKVVQGNAEIRSRLDEANIQITGLQDGAARLEQATQDLQTLVSGALRGQPTPSVPTSILPGSAAAGSGQTTGRSIAGTPALAAFPPSAPIPAPRSGQGHLFGVVWADGNGNGIPDAGEQAISGVRIVLRSATAEELASTVTGADGRYLFADLDPNTYEVVAFIPRTLAPTRPHTVSLTVGSDEAVEVNLDSLAP